MSLNKLGCPRIPIKIDNRNFTIDFDTGCAPGITLTNLMDGKITYTLLGQTEQLNRDGSHRGWSKSIRINDLSVFGEKYAAVTSVIADWKMFSSEKFNGIIGLKYFKSKLVTLDYTGRKIAITNHPPDYKNLDMDKYIVLPLLKTKLNNQENLLFFEAKLNGASIIVYLDTGKNHSYMHNPDSSLSTGTSESNVPRKNIVINLGGMQLTLKGLEEVNITQVTDLPYPVMIELNSDQIRKNNLLVTIDLINHSIIFRK
ncbi:hypothetical protein Ana3638_08125 [Anaerocolumna sedimenticola]|uniref:Uncharacterized protein n=1 Tax=Anaerocolumna sedimenticola TaxID=2696063 RepID=A0A6P1THX4_9FIRM|nr:hypothetical protein [Anaerocolumna sedimenticola]QHQ60744.1 hypothetical protein Ana3638_08125 [Anaerocolumna sedimenticola]